MWKLELRNSSEDVRCLAAFALGEIGKDAAQALPALRASAGDSSPLVRETAERAIGKLVNIERR